MENTTNQEVKGSFSGRFLDKLADHLAKSVVAIIGTPLLLWGLSYFPSVKRILWDQHVSLGWLLIAVVPAVSFIVVVCLASKRYRPAPVVIFDPLFCQMHEYFDMQRDRVLSNYSGKVSVANPLPVRVGFISAATKYGDAADHFPSPIIVEPFSVVQKDVSFTLALPNRVRPRKRGEFKLRLALKGVHGRKVWSRICVMYYPMTKELEKINHTTFIKTQEQQERAQLAMAESARKAQSVMFAEPVQDTANKTKSTS
ncbi:MAG: hypothetical protein ABR889_05015 [Acidobacteriaceae bacterium]|jgi:hypothetical protein